MIIMSRCDVLLRSGFRLSLVALAMAAAEQVLEMGPRPSQAIMNGLNGPSVQDT